MNAYTDRWMRSMSSMPEAEVVSLLTLAATELAYRHRSTCAEIFSRALGLPDPWELKIDARSHVPMPKLTLAGAIWESMTGRRILRRKAVEH